MARGDNRKTLKMRRKAGQAAKKARAKRRAETVKAKRKSA